ncbi:Transducin/WD40 repeat-like superfamily protein [Rhynchospora pubera]|uniref:Transducin/WD40 repeat-like superfamily protein n=1 Tax=Rhynchospora pubera TaxID=906938 RepID=A0AAV8EQP2_9POAL|nr:Transducin/WD40 repeat-like superfamily protein [Rhynchospora pubera]
MNPRRDLTTNQPSLAGQNEQLDLQEVDLQEEEVPRLEWDFSLLASILSSSSSLLASDSIGSIAFSPCNDNSTYDSLLATAGIARKIRVYHLGSLIKCVVQSQPSVSICTPAKLSSVRFRSRNVIAAGDYDGVVTEYDITRGCRTAMYERDEHGGRRIWSIDYSSYTSLAASGSDDCTAHLWDPRANSDTLHETIPFTSPVCCVEFDPSGDPFFATGCADKKAYVYDVRMVRQGPVKVLERHMRAVTYVRFAGHGRLVSSGADGQHMLWDWSNGQCVREYTGHMSSRSFVGMGVWMHNGLVASGSESNEVFVYDLRWGRPVWVQGFAEHVDSTSEVHERRRNGGFVSAVSWWQGTGDRAGDDNGVLVAGGTDGVVKVFGCKRKEQIE